MIRATSSFSTKWTDYIGSLSKSAEFLVVLLCWAEMRVLRWAVLVGRYGEPPVSVRDGKLMSGDFTVNPLLIFIGTRTWDY